jgi:hypothetical protein
MTSAPRRACARGGRAWTGHGLVFADESGEPLRDLARIDAVVDTDGGHRSPAAAGSDHFVAGGAGDVIGDLSAGRSSVAEVPRGSNVTIEPSL